MTVVMPAEPSAPASGPEVARQLAARIDVPLQLPTRYDGERIKHLSKSSYELWVRCPEAFRLRYICGLREPTGAVMFLGSRVDEAMSHYHRVRLDTGERLDVAEVQQFYRRNWSEQLERERAERGVDFSELHEHAAFHIGLDAVRVCIERLVPQLGEPVAVQRKFELRLAPAAEWTIQGYPDLETRRFELGSDDPIEGVVDWKVKGNPLTQQRADRDVQASLYLAARSVERTPAADFGFAQVLRPGSKRAKIGSSLVRTRRTPGQLRAILARFALAASQIAWLAETYGPERPWSFADPTSWACSERFCDFYRDCPGGAGL